MKVLTLIAAAGETLAPTRIEAARDALARLGAKLGDVDWLAPDAACDIYFSELAADQADSAARVALHGAKIDAIAQGAEGRRKRLLVADMESTIIRQEMLDELADLVGIRDQIAAITARAMNGEVEFKAALRERVALLKDLPASALEEVYARVELTPGAAALVRTMRADGAYCALVSGGFTFFTDRVRDAVGFDVDQANVIDVADGKLTGMVAEPILDRDAKLQALTRLAAERRVPLSATLAVGDGANDLPMLQAAGLGVAFHAKPAVAAAVSARVDHGDLTALLYAQGYRAGEFAAG